MARDSSDNRSSKHSSVALEPHLSDLVQSVAAAWAVAWAVQPVATCMDRSLPLVAVVLAPSVVVPSGEAMVALDRLECRSLHQHRPSLHPEQHHQHQHTRLLPHAQHQVQVQQLVAVAESSGT
jgi:hypothetical protein